MKADLILNIAFPAFLSQLPDPELGDVTGAQTSKKHFRVILSALADLCFSKGIFDILTVRLLNRLPSAAKFDDKSATYTQSILATILLVLQRNAGDSDWDKIFFFESLVPKLTSITITAALELSSQSYPAIYAPASVRIVAKIVNLLVRSVPADSQVDFAIQLFKLFYLSEESTLISELYRSQVATVFKPLAAASSPEGLLELFTAAVAGLHCEVKLPVSSAFQFASDLIPVTLANENSRDRLALLRLITLVVNKWFSKNDETKYLETIVDGLRQNLTNSNDIELCIGSLEQLSWILKAYVLKSNRQAFESIEQILGLLRDPDMGAYASKSCGIMISDDEIVDKSNFVVSRLLSKQSYFSFVIQKLVDGFNSSVDTVPKKNYLVALSTILQYMPGKIVLPQLSTFLPLLLQSLSLDDAQVKLASIDTISATMSDASSLMSEHLSTVIPRLLMATTPKPSNPAGVRVAALNALGIFTKTISADTLRPYRADIIRKLAPVLDDPKREVRKAGVDCRQAYYAMDE